MDFADLSDDQYAAMLRLRRYYHREARKCRAKKAYLAGCVMLAAALEAELIAAVVCLQDDLADCKCLPHEKGEVKPVLRWKLGEQLRVAKAAGWLPSGLELGEEWDHERAEVGDYAEALRMIRNQVHPAQCLPHEHGKPVKSKHLKYAFQILDGANQYLLASVAQALHEATVAEGAED